MHCLLLVTGEDIDDQLAVFSDHFQVEPYEVVMDHEEIASMAAHLEMDPADLEQLAKKMPKWNNETGSVRDGQLIYTTRENPHGKYDWYEVGGRFNNYLELREAKEPGILSLIGKPRRTHTNKARKGEIVLKSIFEDLPAAILHEGHWVGAPLELELTPGQTEAWRSECQKVLSALPDECRLTAIDLHS